MTRAEKISTGKVWQVYYATDEDNVLFEGCRTRCLRFIREHFGMRAYKTGVVHLAKLVWEA